MLPQYLIEDIHSSAERRIFNLFKNNNKTENWYVLHSVGLSQHIHYMYGEIDFVILAPLLGIFCLEVKGGRVSIHNGVWKFTDRNNNSNTSSRGPFKQVEEGFFSLRKFLEKNLPSDKKYILNAVSGVGVMFPDIFYSNVGTEEDKQLVYDASNNEDIYTYILDLAAYTEDKMLQKHLNPYRPTEDDIETVRNLIRGDFSFEITRVSNTHLALDKMNEITSRQMSALSLIQVNNHCFFYGHAGTGKTIMAIETATRLQSQGLKVGLFCYNKLLAKWMNTVLEKNPYKPSYVGNIHSYIMNNSALSQNSITDWKKMTSIFVKNIINLRVEKFDAIVIDEAQDLSSPTYFIFFDSILKGGLENGRVYIFGDFMTQNIFETDLPSYEKINLINLLFKNITKYPLTINCRNTNNIHNLVSYSFNIEQEMWAPANIQGPPYEFIDLNDKQKIINTITNLLNSGVRPDSITILSPFKINNSETAKIISTNTTINALLNSEHGIVFSTIKSYKGLENDYIFVCDVKETDYNETLYVAFTRARYSLYIVGNCNLLKRMVSRDGKNC